MQVDAVSNAVVSPRDPVSGLPTGKRQYVAATPTHPPAPSDTVVTLSPNALALALAEAAVEGPVQGPVPGT